MLPAGLVWGAGSCWTALLLWEPRGSHAGQGTAPIASPNAESALGLHGELSPSWPGSAPVLPAVHPGWWALGPSGAALVPQPLSLTPIPAPAASVPPACPGPAVRSVSCATLAVSALCQACVCGSLTVNYNAL